ncbi:MAG TPA: Spy/CpxP family protein refolding chaperone [Kofleriaceae bacterium]|nr:Spy/CpxP family protein refolding chaperone [Kofleriaceae bacterium]
MRTIVALLVVLLASPAAFAQRSNTIADELDLSANVNAKVVTVLKAYDAEMTRLNDQRRDLRRKLLSARRDPAAADRLIDEGLANQRARVRAEETLMTNLRAVLTPTQIATVVVMLDASEPDATPPEPRASTRRERTRTASYDRDSLWPPGSTRSDTCDPFASMHGCLR